MIALLGDTHLPRGRRRLSDECLRLLARAELILHVGDFVAASVLAELRELAPVEAVHGNVDEPGLQALLPERLVVEAGGLRIALVHDGGRRAGREERPRSWFPDAGLVAYGHNHLPEVTHAGGAWTVNPGSPTEPRRAPAPTMVVVHAGRPQLVELAP